MSEPIYEAAAFDAGFAPMPSLCPRCVPGSHGAICRVCAAEIATALRDRDDDLVAVHHNGHGIYHHSYRSDVTR